MNVNKQLSVIPTASVIQPIIKIINSMRHGLFFILFFKLFIYNVLPLLYTFLSCSSHIVNTFYLVFFFFKFLHPEFVSYVTML